MTHGPRRRTVLLAAGPALWAAAPARAGAAATAATTAITPTNNATNNATPAASHPWLPQSRRIGQGTLRVLGFAAYDASLFALPDFAGTDFAAHPLVLEIRYRRAITGTAIADYSLAQMRRGNPPLDQATAERWLQFMRRAFPDVQSGDRLTGLWLPAGGLSRFAANEAAPIEWREALFGPRFFGIWLATDTPRPELRAQLLGLDGDGTAGSR